MDGDAFEMEDQRNWTDASYKTYCTPLALPYPVTVEAGETVRQSVTVALRGPSPSPRVGTRSVDVTSVVQLSQDVVGAMPCIGLGSPSHGASPTEDESARLRALRPGHLRVDIRTASPGWQEVATAVARLAADIDTPLEVAVLMPSGAADTAAQSVLGWARVERPQIARWVVLHDDMSTTSAATFSAARSVLSSYEGDALFGVGTDCYFTELNRDRPDVTDADFVSYSMNPQVHAFDDASLMETLEAQSVTARSARAFAGSAGVVVSPVTLRPRFNPNATGEPVDDASGELPFEVDPRQMSLFAAAWTLGSIAGLASAGVQSATYYEPAGLRGAMDASALGDRPRGFARVAGGVYPLYHVLRDVCAFAGGTVLRSVVSDPLDIAALALRAGPRRATWVANLGASEREVSVVGLMPGSYRMRTLDIASAEHAMRDPEPYRRDVAQLHVGERALTLSIGAYSIVCVGTDAVG